MDKSLRRRKREKSKDWRTRQLDNSTNSTSSNTTNNNIVNKTTPTLSPHHDICQTINNNKDYNKDNNTIYNTITTTTTTKAATSNKYNTPSPPSPTFHDHLKSALPILACLFVLLSAGAAWLGFRGRVKVIGVDLGTTYSVVAVRAGRGGISDVEVRRK